MIACDVPELLMGMLWIGEEGEKKSMLECCRPLKVEVFRLEDESLLKDWTEFRSPDYAGRHGMRVPTGEGQQ